jgi:outer membrane protein assembly factor BamB
VNSAEPGIGRQQVQYPGGIAARFRWGSVGHADEVFSISESTGTLSDFAPLVVDAAGESPAVCRAELRVESPVGAWTARFASDIFDQPQGVLWDVPALLLVKYGFHLYAMRARTGELAWSYSTGTPALAVLSSTRLDHVLLQTELETVALRDNGEVAWRAAHSDVITDAQLIAGRLDLTTYSGQHVYLDATSGQQA